MEDKMTLFVDGLDPLVKLLVARQREKQASIKFLDLVQVDENALRAHVQQSRATAIFTPKALPTRSVKPAAKGLYAETV